MRHEEISRFKFESGRIVTRTRLIRSAFLSVRGKNDREENDGFGKAAKRRQEVARRGERERERERGRSRKWNDAAPGRMHDFLRESTKATGIALLSGLSISMGTATYPEVEDHRVKSV